MWCPPGATWHYFNNYLQINSYKSGVTELQYTGTVTVNSIVCKQIIGTFTGVSPFPFSPVGTYTILDFRTYENNNVYYLYDPSTNAFDTICNFNASVGNKWRPTMLPQSTSTNCGFPRPYVTVIDTGHVTINSNYLKRIVVQDNISFQKDTIIEKIGGFNQFLLTYYNCITDVPPYGTLMCYQDNNFPLFKKPQYNTCNYDPTNIEEHEIPEYKFYPDPVGAILNVASKKGEQIEVRIFDLAGREVLVSITKSQMSYIVNLEKLTKGIYFVRLYSSGQFLGVKKIIKE